MPTRERCDTLLHALRTCVLQDYDKLEILVSDNHSQDRTREVVESLRDRRILYLNTGKRLSMTDNFEFALSRVRPVGYIIYIGDDDGLLPRSISELNETVKGTGASVLRWSLPNYWWPNTGNRYANQLIIPTLKSRVFLKNAAETIQKILSFEEPYTVSLPVMYQYSAVSYEIIRRIKSSSGRFFHSMVPDVNSGFAIAGSVDSFHYSEKPYAIGGVSKHSGGAGAMSLSLGAPVHLFMSENNMPFHSDLVFCPGSVPLTELECFLQARDHLQFSREFTVDMAKALFLMMKEAAPKASSQYAAVKDAVLKIGQMHDMPDAAQKAIAANPKREPGSGRKLSFRNLISGGSYLAKLFMTDLRKRSYYLDCSTLNVRNIYDASLLCDHILRLRDMKVFGFPAVLKSSLTNMRRIIAPENLTLNTETQSTHGKAVFPG